MVDCMASVSPMYSVAPMDSMTVEITTMVNACVASVAGLSDVSTSASIALLGTMTGVVSIASAVTKVTTFAKTCVGGVGS